MFNSIKKLFTKNKSEKISKNLFAILGVSIGILLSIVIIQLNNIQEAYQNLARVEHLNSNVQRLSKLSVLDHDITITLHYLDQEISNLFSSNTNHSMMSVDSDIVYGIANEMVREWGLLKNLILEDKVNHNDIYLLSDNFHFKSNELMTYIELEINTLLKLVFILHTVLSIVSVFTALISFSRMLSFKTELEHLKELNEFSSIDISTGLYNRSKCQELFKRHNAGTPNVNNAIVVFDLNDLKKANDNHGHQTGDELINTFANLLAQSTKIHNIRPFLGRYGGDEFIIYYDYIDNPKEINYLLHELKDLTEQFNLTKKEFQVSYAVGFAINSEKENLPVRALFDKADAYMYTNKVKVKDGIKIEYPNFEEDDDTERQKTFTPVSGELERLFPALPDKEDIENRHKKSLNHNKKVITIYTIILFTIGGITTFHDKVGKTVIDNNVLYLSDNSTRAPEDKIIGSPWRNSSLASTLLFRTIFSTDSTFQQINPSLAQEFEILNDGLTYKIILKPEEYWSDGTLITMDDIVFSIETFLLASNTNTNIATAFNKIVGADNFKNGITSSLEGLKVDGLTLTVNLDKRYNLFLSMLTQFAPLPKHLLENVDPEVITGEIDYYSSPVTSGMYLLDGLNDDGNFVLTHNPHYNGQIPNIDEVVLVSGYTPLDIDFYSTNVMSDVIDYRSIKDFNEYAVDVHFYRYFVYNIQGMEGSDEYNPISDVRVRQALMYAIDRQYLLDIIYLNMGKILAEEDDDGFGEQQYQYSPNKARSLLEEANYDFDRPIKIMYYYSDDISYIFLEKIAEYYQDIGLKVELIKSTGSEQLYDIRDYDLMLKGLSSFNEYDWYNEYISSNANLSQVYGTTVFDELVDLLFSTIDAQEYNGILKDLQEIEENLIYKMPLYSFDQYVFLNSNKVKIPNDVIFANTAYRYDVKFENWSINKG